MKTFTVYLLLFSVTLLLLPPIYLAAQPEELESTFRNYHDHRGRSVSLRTLKIADEHVFVQQENGTLHTLKISAFSKADQQYIRSLSISHPAKTDSVGTSWPCFRGPTGQGVSTSEHLPLTWSDSENIRWKTPLPGAGASSPIAILDRIYVTSYSGYFVPKQEGGTLKDLKRHLIAVDKNTGKILWNKSVVAKQPEEERIRDHGFAASTPAADADGIVVFYGKSGVIAYDHDGNEKWTADVGSKTSGWGSSASPVFYKDIVIINACVESGSLIALNRRTGEENWRAEGINESWSTPLVITAPTGRVELVLAAKPQILAFDPSNGKKLWSCDTDISWYMVPMPIESAGVVYAFGGRSGTRSLAVRSGGDGDVTASHRLWISNKGSNVTSPVFHDDHLYWMHEKLGIAYCAEPRSGELLYEQRVPRSDQIYGSALLAGDRIYYFNRWGRAFVIAANTEYKLLSTNELEDGGMFNGSPAVSGNHLIVRSDKFLYCIGE